MITQTRQAMKELINAAKNLKTSRNADVFEEIAFNFDQQNITYLNQRQQANITIQYLVSPNTTTSNTAPSITYDEIIKSFDAGKGEAFKKYNLILIGYEYTQSDIVTDPTTGSVSLSFSINIKVTEKKR